MRQSSRWQPGRLLVGWALGVLTTIGLVTMVGGWYEFRELSSVAGSGSPARQVNPTDSACQVDRPGAINVAGFEVVPGQSDPCYLRRPRIRPWQWADGIRELIGRLQGAARSLLPPPGGAVARSPARILLATAYQSMTVVA